MRKVALALALAGLLAAPATADLSDLLTTKALGPSTGGKIGILTSNGGIYGTHTTFSGIQPADLLLDASVGDTVQLTFAFVWPYNTGPSDLGVLVRGYRSMFSWDTSEVELLGLGNSGPFARGSFDSDPGAAAANLNAAITNPGGVTSFGFEQNPSASNSSGNDFQLLGGGGPLPFMRVTFRVLAPSPLGGLDAFFGQQAVSGTSAGVVFNQIAGTTLSPTPWGGNKVVFVTTGDPSGPFITAGGSIDQTFGLSVVPEPASASLLAVGLLAIGGGFYRRRRRFS